MSVCTVVFFLSHSGRKLVRGSLYNIFISSGFEYLVAQVGRLALVYLVLAFPIHSLKSGIMSIIPSRSA